MKTVELQNIGPIERLTIPLPDAGVVVLRGRNGVGKSHALAAVDSLVSGRGRPPCRDGAAKATVEGFGAKLTIGRSQRRTGEAEVLTLEGRLDIAQFVSPPIKDEESADRYRIKALLQLSGASADPSEFSRILPSGLSLDQLVPDADRPDDPVALAAQIKRELESLARNFEQRAAEAKARATALMVEVKPLKHIDVKAAERDLQDALLELKELETRAAEVERHREQAAKAQETIGALKVHLTKLDPTQLSTEIEQLKLDIQKLEKALAVARERLAQAEHNLVSGRQVQSQIETLQRIIDSSPAQVTPEDLQQAQARVAQAKQLHALAMEAQRSRELAIEADRAKAAQAEAEHRAEAYRTAAARVEGILGDLVGSVTELVGVENGRLVCDTDRGVEPFAELSPGERWRIALEIAVEQLGKGGLVTVPQEAWESLDPVNRAQVVAIAREVGVVVLTAEADASEQITAELLQ